MAPPVNIILGCAAIFDAGVFWFIGQAVASGNLARPIPPGLSEEEKAKQDRMHRRGGQVILKAAPAMAVLGLIMLALPLQPSQIVMVFLGGILSIVGWILYSTLSANRNPPSDRGDTPGSGTDRDLPIR